MIKNISFKGVEIPSRLFVTGIGTDVGKTFVTGKIAKILKDEGRSVITQKFIQTGNVGRSEDIEMHRKIMGIELLEEDKEKLTAPVIYSYPCSPNLAARIDNRELDMKVIDRASDELSARFDHVLIEGAGGVMVPLKGDYLTIDYIRERMLPTVVTYNGQLGSINHTLLTLKALIENNIPIFALVYNSHFDVDKMICADTKEYMQRWIEENSPETMHFEI